MQTYSAFFKKSLTVIISFSFLSVITPVSLTFAQQGETPTPRGDHRIIVFNDGSKKQTNGKANFNVNGKLDITYEVTDCSANNQDCLTAQNNYEAALRNVMIARQSYFNIYTKIFETYLSENIPDDSKTKDKLIKELRIELDKLKAVQINAFSKDNLLGLANLIASIKKAKDEKNEYEQDFQQSKHKDYFIEVEKLLKIEKKLKITSDESEYRDQPIESYISQQRAKLQEALNILDGVEAKFTSNAAAINTLWGIKKSLKDKKTDLAIAKQNLTSKITLLSTAIDQAITAKALLPVFQGEIPEKPKTPGKTIKILRAKYGHFAREAKNRTDKNQCSATGYVKSQCEYIFKTQKYCINDGNIKLSTDPACNNVDDSLKFDHTSYLKLSSSDICKTPVTVTNMCGGFNPAPNSDRKLEVKFKCDSNGETHTACAKEGEELILYCPYDAARGLPTSCHGG